MTFCSYDYLCKFKGPASQCGHIIKENLFTPNGGQINIKQLTKIQHSLDLQSRCHTWWKPCELSNPLFYTTVPQTGRRVNYMSQADKNSIFNMPCVIAYLIVTHVGSTYKWEANWHPVICFNKLRKHSYQTTKISYLSATGQKLDG